MAISLILIFLISAALPLLLKGEKLIRRMAIGSAIVGGGAVLFASFPILFSQAPAWATGWLALDAFSAFMLTLVALIYMAAMLVSYRYVGHEYHEGIINLAQVRTYFCLIALFAFSMVMVLLANNTILLWIALEGTTLSSTFLVGLYKKRNSIEAAWKYIILCSTGITLGLVGVLLMNYAAHLIGGNHDIFALTFLDENAAALPAIVVKWAFVFLFVGFGTKVGLVPMHAWLPDAHSKAPSPVSAMFSGVLLNVALYVIMRFKHIVDETLASPDWTNHFFLIFGTISVILPALVLLIQNNYKRMLAYSSIEHMGLISIAIALPPLGLVAAFIHMIGHTFSKSLLFFGAGEFLQKWKTTKVDKISHLMEYAPYSGVLFLIGILAIIATPPFLLFSSEFILLSELIRKYPALAVVILAALSVIAFAMLRLTISLLYRREGEVKMEKENWGVVHTVMAVELALVIGLSFVLTSGRGLEFIGSLVKIVS